MPPDDSLLTNLDVLILAFLAGVVVAALLLWPMRRGRSRDASRTTSGRAGKHALRSDTSRARGTTSASRRARERPTARAEPAVAPEPADSAAAAPTSQAAASVEVPEEGKATSDDPSAPREPNRTELPVPIDLYQRRYAARFERARNRMARIRQELEQA